jgi:hypothetical protein
MRNDQVEQPLRSPFWPIFLLALAFSVFAGWQLVAGLRQYVYGIRLDERQTAVAEQARQTEAQLQSLMMDVLKLAETDADASNIVKKYNVKFNPAREEGASTDMDALLEKLSTKPPATTKPEPPGAPDAVDQKPSD